ncbi:hypothetical protein [Amycolatopsis sp. DG1A-15b]|uniref:hypothetical protein n=1 Tax=Amycolatopsis sp. DG1A-15b TaxID=3052846 RepID=UPI00255BF658|nr:hypothetical protein [Amycolatopsis sp. DG1A-15b]WIX85726.1 hypothetical protein QRY02_31545 [Amycolatopsis sp. DG1A-15b]
MGDLQSPAIVVLGWHVARGVRCPDCSHPDLICRRSNEREGSALSDAPDDGERKNSSFKVTIILGYKASRLPSLILVGSLLLAIVALLIAIII